MENRAYAGFFVRMIAYLVDSLIAFIIAGLIKLPFGIAAGVGLSSLKANFIFEHSFIDVLGYVAVVAYFILMTYFTHTTLGKMLFRLEVVTEDGEWSFVNILYRETVGRFLSDIMCIGYLAVIISNKRQGFHDMLCDTYVVYKDMVSTITPALAATGGGAVSGAETCTADTIPVQSGGESDMSESEKIEKQTEVSEMPENDSFKGTPIVSAFIMPGEEDDKQ